MKHFDQIEENRVHSRNAVCRNSESQSLQILLENLRCFFKQFRTEKKAYGGIK